MIKNFPILKKLPRSYKGTYRKITKGKFKGWFQIFEHGNKQNNSR